MTTLLCKQNASLTLASQVLLNLCALLNLCDSEYQKNYLCWEVNSYPYGMLKMEWTNIYFYVLEILFMWIPMQGIKFRDRMSVVCTSNWNGSPASAKLKRK